MQLSIVGKKNIIINNRKQKEGKWFHLLITSVENK